MEQVHILSLGAGVQSSTMALMRDFARRLQDVRKII